MKIKEFLKNNILITDGAMGTYYSEITKKSAAMSVLANLNEPEVIEKIHREYISAGSGIIRTNTFRANTVALERDIDFVKKVIIKACEIAKKAAAKSKVFIGASIGPIPDNGESDHTAQYREIADCFLSQEIDIFVFETFYGLEYIRETADYIKRKNKDAFIICQFSVNDTGVTKKAVGAKRIVSKLKDCKDIDVIGFNCGTGPLHMLNVIKNIPNPGEKMLSALPNAGYPEVVEGKTGYATAPEYFAETCEKIIFQNVKIIGGCCGTTPEHIRLLKDYIKKDTFSKNKDFISVKESRNKPKAKDDFHKKLENGDFIIAVEIDPPFNASADKMIKGAAWLKENGADIITIADSPMGRARAESLIIASKISRETGVAVLPHLCCRDRNSISLRSGVIAGYIEGIRSFLAVTGDPVSDDLRGSTKSVFEFNSYSLINMICEMNNDIFEEEYVKVGGAVNFNVKNKELEYKRLLKKADAGAEFFLSQPVFDEDAFEFIKGISKERDFKILGGIMPLVSYRNAEFINNELPGITIPQKYAKRFSPDMKREEAEKVGIEMAVELAEKMRDYVDGFYIITPFNRYGMISEILRRLMKNVR